jgi:hypothetical protein
MCAGAGAVRSARFRGDARASVLLEGMPESVVTPVALGRWFQTLSDGDFDAVVVAAATTVAWEMEEIHVRDVNALVKVIRERYRGRLYARMPRCLRNGKNPQHTPWLNEVQVRIIRRCGRVVTNSVLGRMFGVSATVISRVRNGKYHLTNGHGSG